MSEVCWHCGEEAGWETAWNGVYWCGKEECALAILEGCCEPLDEEVEDEK